MRKLRAHYFELIENANFMYYLACLYPEQMKERVSKLTYPTLQHCLRRLYTMNGNSKH